MHTPAGMFSVLSVVQTHDRQQNIRGSRKILAQKKELLELPVANIEEFESDSAARCRVYRRSDNKVCVYLQRFLSSG